MRRGPKQSCLEIHKNLGLAAVLPWLSDVLLSSGTRRTSSLFMPYAHLLALCQLPTTLLPKKCPRAQGKKEWDEMRCHVTSRPPTAASPAGDY